jgi:hypothetical protein
MSLAFAPSVAEAAGEPDSTHWKTWRIDDALPDWISLSAEHRTRYESLDDEFRAGTRGDREILVLRTLVHGRLELADGLWLGAEVEDSRAEVNGDTLLNTTIVNAVELLRGYLELNRKDVFGGTLSAQAGRITMDLGSRRFVARNRYRNTINGFTGIDVAWQSEGGTELRSFWTLPVRRQPVRFDQLRDNKIQDDEEDFDLQFWGVYASSDLPAVGRGEIFVLGLREQDEPSRRTRKRELYTPGFRLFRKPGPERFDYTVESALQFGRSRANATAARLDHFAHFEHLEVGYTFDAPWSPRLVVQYDFASGDEDPTDGDNNRFDTLFGARRFDFGPTGIYGPFARSNLSSPGLRLQLAPARTVTSFLALRSFWLANRSDAWTTTGVRDADGKSGRYLGTQIEMRMRWNVLPGNLRLEAGYAHLFEGEFIEDAPNSSRPGDLNYFYVQAAIKL